MSKVVITKNPFQPDKGRTITEYSGSIAGLRAWLDDKEVKIVVDGWAVGDDYVPKPNELVEVFPLVGGGGGGKKIFGIVAMIGLAILSSGIASGHIWAAGFKAAFGAAATTWQFIAASAILFIGGTLINRMTAVKPDLGNYDTENNPTYSWGDVQTMEGQNNPIAKTYGKVKSAGQTLGKFVSFDGDDEVLNWLIGAGEGELEFSDIKLNNNSVSYYEKISVETRPGTNDQTIISNFNDTYFTSNLGYELTGTDWRTNEAQGNATEGLTVKIECPIGLFYTKDDGELSTAWVKVQMQYRLYGAANWTDWQTVRIEGAQNSALRKEYRKDHLTAGRYEVRVRVTERSHSETSTRASVKTLWSSVTSIVYDDFTYPGIALIGIKGLATSQLSGSPTLSFVKERKYVWVYNPYIGGHEQRAANNPAWAAYDMLHCCRRLKNINTGEYEYVVEGVPANHIIYEQFNEWADWCDDNNFHINIEINSTGEMLDIINNKMACVGRGMVIRFGTRYGCKWSHVQSPVQMFGMGNIIKDSFTETFLSKNDRANCVEITFTDAERDYERRTITVFGDNYNTDPVAKPSQITYDGITSYEQAYREGKFLMKCNERLLRTVAFDVDIDALALTIGDLCIVAHDVVQWANSGRIESVNGLTVVLPSIDAPITGQRYILGWRDDATDTLHNAAVTVVSYEDNKITVTLNSAPSVPPVVGEIFNFAIVDESRGLFTIQSITRSDKFRRHIEALQYDANVYSEQYDIPSIIYTREGDVAVDVTGLSASQIAYTKKDGTRASRMFASWNVAASGGRYTVLTSVDGQNWDVRLSGTSNNNVKFDVEPYSIYYVKVITTLGVTQSPGVIAYPVPPGEDVLPPNVTELNAERIAGGTRRYYWKFTYPDPNDIAGFRMKVIPGAVANWEMGVDVQNGLITNQPYEATTVRQGVHTVMIKAVDNIGQESAGFAACVMDFGDILVDNVLQTDDFSENQWIRFWNTGFWPSDMQTPFWPADMQTPFWRTDKIGGLYVDGNNWLRSASSTAAWSSPSLPAWERTRDDKFWPADMQTPFWPVDTQEDFWGDHIIDNPAWAASWSNIYAETEVTATAGGYWWLEYEIVGRVKIYYWLNNDGIRKNYSTRVKVKAGDIIHVRIEGLPDEVIIKKLISVIDVPDRIEHFDNLTITTDGVELPIKTPHYKTVAVNIDSLPIDGTTPLYPLIVSREPCILKLVSADGTAHSATAQRITWQGYEYEVNNNG